jgi:hypothetical protein
MTVSFIGAASAEATSLTLPTHQAGDLLVMLALRYDNANPGTIPSGWAPRWITQRNGSFVQNHIALAYRIASSSADASGTWINFTHLLCAVYRDDANYIVLNCPNVARGTGTSVTFPALAVNPTSLNAAGFGGFMAQTAGWVIGVAAAHLNTSEINVAPSGMTNRASLAGASNGRIALHDTNAAVASFTSASSTVTSSTDWVTNVAEIIDTGSPKATGGGGFRAVNIRGGADQ